MAQEKSLQELQAYHNRLISDVRRSQQLDPDGLSNFSPLIKNLRECEKQIKAKQSQ